MKKLNATNAIAVLSLGLIFSVVVVGCGGGNDTTESALTKNAALSAPSTAAKAGSSDGGAGGGSTTIAASAAGSADGGTGKSVTAAKKNGTYTKAPGCHAVGISAAIEVLSSDGLWTTHKDALGWESSDTSCPSTHPVTPWTAVTLANSSTVRWKYSGPGWTTYSTSWEWVQN